MSADLEDFFPQLFVPGELFDIFYRQHMGFRRPELCAGLDLRMGPNASGTVPRLFSKSSVFVMNVSPLPVSCTDMPKEQARIGGAAPTVVYLCKRMERNSKKHAEDGRLSPRRQTRWKTAAVFYAVKRG